MRREASSGHYDDERRTWVDPPHHAMGSVQGDDGGHIVDVPPTLPMLAVPAFPLPLRSNNNYNNDVEYASIGGDDPARHLPPIVDDGELPRLSQWRIAGMEAFWFSILFGFCSLYLVIVPAKVLAIVGSDRKTSVYGSLVSAGSCMNLIMQPLAGAISDNLDLPFLGRRRPCLMVSGWIAAGSAIWLCQADNLAQLAMAFICLSFGLNSSIPVMTALLPDVVPPSQRGNVAGWVVVLYSVGSLGGTLSAGFLIGPLGYQACGYIVAGVIVAGTVFVLLFVPPCHRVSMPEAIAAKSQPLASRALSSLGGFFLDFIRPFLHADFRWVFLTSFLFYAGNLIVVNYSFYYLDDVVKHFSVFGLFTFTETEKASSVWTSTSLVAQTISSPIAGFLADQPRIGKKPVSCFGSIMVVISAAVVMASTEYVVTLVGSIFLGLGIGIATTANMSISSHVTSLERKEISFGNLFKRKSSADAISISINNSSSSDSDTLLPGNKDKQPVHHGPMRSNSNAKDMGLLSNCTNFAQIIASLLSGYIVQAIRPHGVRYGYITIFCMSVGYCLLGSLTVWRIKCVK